MTVPLRWRADGPLDAPVLVLLNSLGASTSMWDPQAAALAEHFRLIRIDTRGHGDSPPAPPGTPAAIADLAADVLGVLDELDLDTVRLAGLSLGGMVALHLAAHHPRRVSRLAVLCTSARLPPASGWLERAATVRAEGTGSIAAAAIIRWITPGLAARDGALVQRLTGDLVAADDESYAQCCEAIAAMDLREDLPRIGARTLVIAGAQDPATPPEHARTIAAGVADAAVVVLEDAAHLATVEASGRITSLLLSHFAAPASGSRSVTTDTAAGFAVRRAVLGDAHVDASVAATSEFSEPFQNFLTRYAWGEVWSRPGLSRRERSITTLAALVSLGAEHEIGMHVRAAVHNGLTPAEISEVLLHTALYAGLPRANRAFAIADAVLADGSEDVAANQ